MKNNNIIDVQFKEVKRSYWARLPWLVRAAIIAAVWFVVSYGLPK